MEIVQLKQSVVHIKLHPSSFFTSGPWCQVTTLCSHVTSLNRHKRRVTEHLWRRPEYKHSQMHRFGIFHEQCQKIQRILQNSKVPFECEDTSKFDDVKGLARMCGVSWIGSDNPIVHEKRDWGRAIMAGWDCAAFLQNWGLQHIKYGEEEKETAINVGRMILLNILFCEV